MLHPCVSEMKLALQYVTALLKFVVKGQPSLDIGTAAGRRLDEHIGHQVNVCSSGVVEAGDKEQIASILSVVGDDIEPAKAFERSI